MKAIAKEVPPDMAGVEGQLLRDLEILCDGPDADLHLAFDGVVMALKSKGRLVWQNSAEARWMRMDSSSRVRFLVGWIREAAQMYRELLAKRTRDHQHVA